MTRAPDTQPGRQTAAFFDRSLFGHVTSRKHVIALEARGKGLLGVTLVRKEEDYFDDIPAENVPKDMLDLAKHIVSTKTGHFKPDEFEDRYEDALKQLLKRKQKGEKIEPPKERAPSNVVNLMEALRQSVQAERGGAKGRTPARPRTAARLNEPTPSTPLSPGKQAEVASRLEVGTT